MNRRVGGWEENGYVPVGNLGEAGVGLLPLHVDEVELPHGHVCVHVEDLVEFAHLEGEERWVGGWVGERMEEEKAVGMSCCRSCMGD